MKDGFFFLGILLIIFVVWVSTGGPSRPVSFAGPYLHPIQTTGTSAQPYGDPSKFSSINSTITVGPSGIAATDGTSALRGAVTLSRDLSGVATSDPDNEYLQIGLAGNAPGTVSTAGWKLVSKESGDGADFPLGTETPYVGRVNQLAPIILHPGDKMVVTTGRSPVGISFRENKCTGYLEEHQDFHPALAQNCPTPSQEFNRFFTGRDDNDTCISYVRSIPYCTTETHTSVNVSSACDDFVSEYLTYNSCVDVHKNEANFTNFTWRVFLGKRTELWEREHETILLLDAGNKVIDVLSY